MKLTNKQVEVFKCIKTFIDKNGYSPSIRELCEITKLNSTATIHTHLKNLASKGYITYVPRAMRTIRIVKEL